MGLERETERVIAAAKRREHIDTCHDEEESCDLSAKSCDLPCGPKGPSHDDDDHTDVTCTSSLQCSSHLTMEPWSSHLYRLLPLDLKWPFHVSTRLNIDATHQSTTKLLQLLLHLQRKFFPFPSPSSYAARLCPCIFGFPKLLFLWDWIECEQKLLILLWLQSLLDSSNMAG